MSLNNIAYDAILNPNKNTIYVKIASSIQKKMLINRSSFMTKRIICYLVRRRRNNRKLRNKERQAIEMKLELDRFFNYENKNSMIIFF